VQQAPAKAGNEDHGKRAPGAKSGQPAMDKKQVLKALPCAPMSMLFVEATAALLQNGLDLL
jgi:hypothetical protein